MDHGNPLLRSAGLLVALLFRLIPKRLRYRAAVKLARILEPLIRHTRAYQRRLRLRTDSLREIALDLVLMMLTRHGTMFDPLIHVEGAEHVAGPGPLLLAGPHTMLSILLTRYMDDRGVDMVAISADPFFIAGTRKPARVLIPSSAFFLQVRRSFDAGEIVAAMIDRGEQERRNVEVETAGGPLLVSDALVQLAVRQKVPVVLFGTHVDDRLGIVLTFEPPSPNSATAEDIMWDFGKFVTRYTSRVAQKPILS